MYRGQSFLAEYPRLRKAETEASGRLPGTPCSASRRSRMVTGYAPRMSPQL